MSVSVETIPLKSDVFNYRFSISLSGILYNFWVRYNARADRWSLNIYDSSNNLIMAGIPLLINRNLMNQYTTLNVLSGVLAVVDTSNKMNQPTMFSFGNNHFLIYFV